MALQFNRDLLSASDQEKLRFIEEITANAESVQDRVLAEILTQNAEAEYLQRYNLGGATDRPTFKAKIPVVTYEDLQPDIERIAAGDRSAVLSSKPVCEFFTSSGTSGGKRKLIPVISDDFHRAFSVGGLCQAVVKLNVPGLDKEEGKYMDFFVLRSETKTSGGLTARSVSTSMYKLCRGSYWAENTCPPAVVHCQDYFQSMYVQFLYGLRQRLQILQLGTGFASGLIRSINFLRNNWPQLVHDIKMGTLTDEITDGSLRDSVSEMLKPDPELASFVADQCSNADWSGIITKIWPNAKCLRTVVTGTMLQYVSMLEFYAGNIPIVSMLYASSESSLGINLKPMCSPLEVSYTLLPTFAYFEFIPHEPGKMTGMIELIDLTKVELGKKYELVVTTYAGLYRYQVGDILQVTGFHNTAPEFKFVGRKGLLLSIDTDKTDEVELQNAVDSASKFLKSYGIAVIEYTSYADTKSTPGHYVIYCELMTEEEKGFDSKVLANCCLAMEETLNQVYKERRASGAIGPLEIRVVNGGTFGELLDHAVSKGASVNQYKVPRCIQLPDIVKLLDSRTVALQFSPACPPLNAHPHQSI